MLQPQEAPAVPGGVSLHSPSGLMPSDRTGHLLSFTLLPERASPATERGVSSAPSGHAEVSLCRPPVHPCLATLELLRAHQGHRPRPAPPRRAAGRPTSFWGGELLGFTARPITSPIDHNHLQLVVAVGKEAGHHAAEAVAREAGLLSLLRHPQVLQQAALPPVVGLWDRGRP